MSEFVRPFSQSISTLLNDFLWKVLNRIGRRNYHLAKACYIRSLERSQRRFGNPPVLVYQMGKVGSSTIMNSLKAIGVDRPVYHPHFLTKKRIVETEADRRKFFRTERYAYLKRPWLYEFLLNQLNQGLTGEKWKVVTLTRESVSRNISVFFENLDVRYVNDNRYEIKSHYYKIPSTQLELNRYEHLSDLFFDRVNHDSPDQFFEREIKGVLNVDVFTHRFPTSKGYCILKGDIADVLVLRLEDLNRVAKDAFNEFLGLKDFKLINANIGSEKNYSRLYKTFKKCVEFPDDYLNRMYDSRYMRHFYTKNEIETFKQKWQTIKTNESNKGLLQ